MEVMKLMVISKQPKLGVEVMELMVIGKFPFVCHDQSLEVAVGNR
jgi:hypothetical protein